MAFDGITVASLVRELNASLADGHISRIAQPEPDEILLSVKTRSGLKKVLLSASASLPLLYLTDQSKLSPMTAPNFCMLLRKHIGSGHILSVTQPSLERIVRFEIEHYDELGDLRKKYLVLELMGKYSNLIFVDENEIILDAIRHVSAQTSSLREVLPGRPYFVPDSLHKLNPKETDENQFCTEVFAKPLPLSKALYTVYTGISPVIAEELCHRASLESDQSAREFPENARIHLYRVFSEMMEDVKAGSFSPRIIYDKDGAPVEFSALPLSMYADYEQKAFDSMSAVVETYYAEKSAVTRIRQKSADLRHVVSTILELESRKLSLQRKQMKDTEKREKFRICGELLNTYGYDVLPGAGSVTVPNYYDGGKDLKIQLDSTLTAQENAQRYFDKYARQKRTAEALTVQIEQTESEVRQLEAISTFLDQAETEADLAQIREELEQSDYVRKRTVTGKKKGASRTKKSEPYHFRTPDGYDIYVGKNNLQNDELTFRFASGGDWWFHAKKIPGSHVIVKTRGTEELPDDVFEMAAGAAAYYSQGRGADKVEIDYVKKKEVKKPGGAKPGFVVYYTNYSMIARPDISRLTLVE